MTSKTLINTKTKAIISLVQFEFMCDVHSTNPCVLVHVYTGGLLHELLRTNFNHKIQDSDKKKLHAIFQALQSAENLI